MPLVVCPKCATNLKVPDGATPAVRCPMCQTVFRPPPSRPAFEVVDEAQAPAPRPVPRPTPTPSTKTSPAVTPDFEPVDEPAPTWRASTANEDGRPRRDDHEDDDRPRARRRRDDDDEGDDRPRARRRRDDDEDEGDDRPRRRRRRDDDDDDYDEYDRPPRKGSPLKAAKVGLLLLSIGFWTYLGTVSLLALLVLLAWAGASLGYGFFLVPGLAGLANWIVAGVGLGFCIAGPARARGLAIAAASVSVVHLVLLFVVANDDKSHFGPAAGARGTAEVRQAERLVKLMQEAASNPARARELQAEMRAVEAQMREERSSRSASSMRWEELGTLLPAVDHLLGQIVYNSKNFGDYVLGLLGGACELARLILIMLMVGAIASAARVHDAAGKAQVGLLVAAIGAGVCLLVLFLFQIILRESKWSDFKTPMNLAAAAQLLVYLGHVAMVALPAVAVQAAYSGVARRVRRASPY